MQSYKLLSTIPNDKFTIFDINKIISNTKHIISKYGFRISIFG